MADPGAVLLVSYRYKAVPDTGSGEACKSLCLSEKRCVVASYTENGVCQLGSTAKGSGNLDTIRGNQWEKMRDCRIPKSKEGNLYD